MSSTPSNKTFDTKDNLKVSLSVSCEYLCTKRMKKRHDAFFCWKDLITGCWFTAGMKHHPDPAWMKVPFGEWKINALADRLRRTACDVLALFLFLRLSSSTFFFFCGLYFCFIWPFSLCSILFFPPSSSLMFFSSLAKGCSDDWQDKDRDNEDVMEPVGSSYQGRSN